MTHVPATNFVAKNNDQCTLLPILMPSTMTDVPATKLLPRTMTKMYLLPILLSRTMTHVPTTHSVAKNNDQNVPAAHFVAKNNHPCTHYSFCCQEQSPIYLLSILLPRTFTHVPATHFDAEEQ